MSTSWTLANIHAQHGTITKAADGTWSWSKDSANDVDPPTEGIFVSGNTVSFLSTQDGSTHVRYEWPTSVSSSDGDIVAADGTTVTGFTHSWGHSSLGTGQITITLDSYGTGGGAGGGGASDGETGDPAPLDTGSTQKKVFCNFW